MITEEDVLVPFSWISKQKLEDIVAILKKEVIHPMILAVIIEQIINFDFKLGNDISVWLKDEGIKISSLDDTRKIGDDVIREIESVLENKLDRLAKQ